MKGKRITRDTSYVTDRRNIPNCKKASLRKDKIFNIPCSSSYTSPSYKLKFFLVKKAV